MRGPSLRGFCPVLLALLVGFSAAAASAPRAAVADGGQVKRLPPLELRLDPSDVDIEGGQIRCELSRPAAKLVLKVLGVDGAVLAQAEQAFEAAPAGSSNATVRLRAAPRPAASAASAASTASSRGQSTRSRRVPGAQRPNADRAAASRPRLARASCSSCRGKPPLSFILGPTIGPVSRSSPRSSRACSRSGSSTVNIARPSLKRTTSPASRRSRPSAMRAVA